MTGYMVTNGCYGQGDDGCYAPRLGVIAHEMGHSRLFGVNIKDLYEVYVAMMDPVGTELLTNSSSNSTEDTNIGHSQLFTRDHALFICAE